MTTDEIIEQAHQIYDEALTTTRKFTGATFNLQLINKVYKEICRRAKCYTGTDTITTVSETREYVKPTGCVSMRLVEYQDSNSYKYKLELIRANEITDEDSFPQAYYLDGLTQGYMGLDPIPDDAYTINRYFFKVPTDLTTGQTPSYVGTDWHHLVSIGLAAEWAKIDTSDSTGKAQRIPAVFENELQAYINWLEEGQNADQFIPVR